MQTYDLIIIGAGPAGYTAAIYAARANIKVLMVVGTTPGGQLLLTSDVENFPGFKDGILGPQLMDEMKAQAKRFGVEIIQEFATKVELGGQPKKLLIGKQEYLTKTIIIATGASANWLGLDSEQKLMGQGVSSCATCDGFFFKDQEVVVVGGGDSAMEESLTLAKLASKVTLIHRRDKFRASKIMQERVLKNNKIEVIWDSEILEVLGKDKVEGVKLKNIKTGKTQKVACQGFFVAVGHTPATGLFKGSLEMDKTGYLVVQDNVKTAIDGVFAAGDVADPLYRQAVTAAGDGCRAALEVERYLESA
ncbi:thioredoxin-disulfide reductase [Candidatus Saccharibacteria bacterium]|nr:thioredoxin-disulfide reductase [Candidatus Saccharibacteria bacterium]